MTPIDSTPALAIEGVSKRFGALTVASNVTIRLPVGARHALIGPNGAGKTTLVNIITGNLAPDGGRVALMGRDITNLPPTTTVPLGLARTFQITNLLGKLSVWENVALAIAARTGADRDLSKPLWRQTAVLDEVHAHLATLDLQGDAERTVRELRYGRQRLVELALGLALHPKVLLLDEPAAGVPSAEAHVILRVLDALPKDMTILMIEHDMEMVFRYAERITVLVGGEVLTEGTPREIAADERVRNVYLGRSSHA
ncbi:MAG: ABC transporter ATP-binding protein [Burkholderiales bacterium]